MVIKRHAGSEAANNQLTKDKEKRRGASFWCACAPKNNRRRGPSNPFKRERVEGCFFIGFLIKKKGKNAVESGIPRMEGYTLSHGDSKRHGVSGSKGIFEIAIIGKLTVPIFQLLDRLPIFRHESMFCSLV